MSRSVLIEDPSRTHFIIDTEGTTCYIELSGLARYSGATRLAFVECLDARCGEENDKQFSMPVFSELARSRGDRGHASERCAASCLRAGSGPGGNAGANRSLDG